MASFWALLTAAFSPIVLASQEQFKEWMYAHNKSYRNNEEFVRRWAVFRQNLGRVDEFNFRGDGAVYDLSGPWSDMSAREFSESVLMPRRSSPAGVLAGARELLRISHEALPESFDWTSKGVVTAVRDQGALGACWALSTAENVEGQYARATGKLVELAAEQLVECDAGVDLSCGGKGSNHTRSDLGCAECGMFGGWPYLGYQYLQRAGGMFLESEWPYSFGKGVYPCMPDGYNKGQCGNHDDMYCRKNSTKGQGPNGLCHAASGFTVQVTGWKALSENETELAAQLVEHGPLSVLLDASGLQSYRSGIWKGGLFGCKPDPSTGVLGLDHAVLLVGFGVEKSWLGKETPYWKVKNSWGAKWGESGFFRLSRGDATCGINLAATTAQVKASSSRDLIV